MTKAVKLVLALLVSALSPVGASADTNRDIVTLTMTERTGVERRAEWVTIGVPLPKGLVKSTDELYLRQNGRTVPCEVLAVNKWWDNGTLRWVHLIFQSDCPANGKALVILTGASAAPSPKDLVTVTDNPDRFVVDTGAITFEVRKKGFNIIDVVKIQDEVIINSHNRGLYVLVEEDEYCAAFDQDVTVTLEEKGPLHVVLRATGSFKNSKGQRKFDFDCRLCAYAGSPEVRVVVTIINRQGKDADYIPLSALILELPLAIHSGDCLFGSENGGTKRGSLSDKPEAYIYQVSSTEHVFGGAVEGRGPGKQTKPNTIGWGYLWGEDKGIGIGTRWFWQMHPKSIEFTRDGMARAGLYPARHDKLLKIYTGVARTLQRTCMPTSALKTCRTVLMGYMTAKCLGKRSYS